MAHLPAPTQVRSGNPWHVKTLPPPWFSADAGCASMIKIGFGPSVIGAAALHARVVRTATCIASPPLQYEDEGWERNLRLHHAFSSWLTGGVHDPSRP